MMRSWFNPFLLFSSGAVAAWLLTAPQAGHGAPSCNPSTAGFDCSPLELKEALAQHALAQATMTQESRESPDRSRAREASAANPDSEAVLEEDARQGDSEALA